MPAVPHPQSRGQHPKGHQGRSPWGGGTERLSGLPPGAHAVRPPGLPPAQHPGAHPLPHPPLPYPGVAVLRHGAGRRGRGRGLGSPSPASPAARTPPLAPPLPASPGFAALWPGVPLSSDRTRWLQPQAVALPPPRGPPAMEAGTGTGTQMEAQPLPEALGPAALGAAELRGQSAGPAEPSASSVLSRLNQDPGRRTHQPWHLPPHSPTVVGPRRGQEVAVRCHPPHGAPGSLSCRRRAGPGLIVLPGHLPARRPTGCPTKPRVPTRKHTPFSHHHVLVLDLVKVCNWINHRPS